MKWTPSRIKPETKELLAIFTAFCLLLSAAENLIPRPVPFIKAGLANIPLMMALPHFGFAEYLLLAILKSLSQCLVSGTLFSPVAVLSLCGSLSSSICMFLLWKISGQGKKQVRKLKFSMTGLSIAGAFCGNCIQIFMASWLIFGSGIYYMAPFILAAGIVSSIFTGFLADYYLKSGETDSFINYLYTSCNQLSSVAIPKKSNMHFFSILLTAAGIIQIPIFILQESLFIKIFSCLIFIILLLITGKKIKLIPPAMILITTTVLSLFIPSGEIIFQKGILTISKGALTTGLERAINLIGMVYLSMLMIRCGKDAIMNQKSILSGAVYYAEKISSGFNRKMLKNPLTLLTQLMQETDLSKQENSYIKKVRNLKTVSVLFACWMSLNVLGLIVI